MIWFQCVAHVCAFLSVPVMAHALHLSVAQYWGTFPPSPCRFAGSNLPVRRSMRRHVSIGHRPGRASIAFFHPDLGYQTAFDFTQAGNEHIPQDGFWYNSVLLDFPAMLILFRSLVPLRHCQYRPFAVCAMLRIARYCRQPDALLIA